MSHERLSPDTSTQVTEGSLPEAELCRIALGSAVSNIPLYFQKVSVLMIDFYRFASTKRK